MFLCKVYCSSFILLPSHLKILKSVNSLREGHTPALGPVKELRVNIVLPVPFGGALIANHTAPPVILSPSLPLELLYSHRERAQALGVPHLLSITCIIRAQRITLCSVHPVTGDHSVGLTLHVTSLLPSPVRHPQLGCISDAFQETSRNFIAAVMESSVHSAVSRLAVQLQILRQEIFVTTQQLSIFILKYLELGLFISLRQ